jgi:hypothetical protein
MNTSKITQHLAITLELANVELSDAACSFLIQELSNYPEEWVLGSLNTIRSTGVRPTLGAIISNFSDGRPDAEEAWASIPKDESSSAVISEEMSASLGVIKDLIYAGDDIAARMAFKEVYKKEVQKARSKGTRPIWFASLGDDKSGREAALLEGAASGRITAKKALSLLPPATENSHLTKLLIGESNPEDKLALENKMNSVIEIDKEEKGSYGSITTPKGLESIIRINEMLKIKSSKTCK